MSESMQTDGETTPVKRTAEETTKKPPPPKKGRKTVVFVDPPKPGAVGTTVAPPSQVQSKTLFEDEEAPLLPPPTPASVPVPVQAPVPVPVAANGRTRKRAAAVPDHSDDTATTRKQDYIFCIVLPTKEIKVYSIPPDGYEKLAELMSAKSPYHGLSPSDFRLALERFVYQTTSPEHKLDKGSKWLLANIKSQESIFSCYERRNGENCALVSLDWSF